MFASMVGEEGVGGWPIAELKREALKRAHREVAVSEKEKGESANGDEGAATCLTRVPSLSSSDVEVWQ